MKMKKKMKMKPRASPQWRHFRLSGLAYHGHTVTVAWDRTGEYYGQGKGFSVHVDGKERFRSDDLRRGCSIGLCSAKKVE